MPAPVLLQTVNSTNAFILAAVLVIVMIALWYFEWTYTSLVIGVGATAIGVYGLWLKQQEDKLKNMTTSAFDKAVEQAPPSYQEAIQNKNPEDIPMDALELTPPSYQEAMKEKELQKREQKIDDKQGIYARP